MSIRHSARKLAAGPGGVYRPILTKTGIDKALKELERRFRVDLSKLNDEDMSPREQDLAVLEIIRVAQARYQLGLKPFSPIEPDEGPPGKCPVPYLSDVEVQALLKLVDAATVNKQYPGGD
jgi:hypothetical protein